MIPEQYEDWCNKLSRCPRTGKVSWPTRALADQAVPVMVARAVASGKDVVDPGAYQCRVPYGCRLYHITRDMARDGRRTVHQRQRENQPDAYREKRRRQRRNRRARDRGDDGPETT